MHLSGMVIWIAGILMVILGALLVVNGVLTPYGIGVIMLGVLFFVIATASFFRQEEMTEPDHIEELDADRAAALVRGTSMHLRDMKYRYSVREDRSGRESFTREVNTIVLGFVPVIITDNHTDRQGYGYVAFPFDGDRWRGPGLPCAGEPDEAVQHAARCVAPLDEDG